MLQIALRNKNNPPTPPFTKEGLGEITDEKGLTLVEVMIALVVLLVVSLALMQTALVSIDANMTNILRDEAVGIAEMRMNEARNQPFASLVSDTGPLAGCSCPGGFPATGNCVQRDLRNISSFDYCSNTTVTELGGDGNPATDDADIRQVDIRVGWRWKGTDYNHRITSIVRRP
jgi:prepilin-type N-terminal cleavage/methylation domain-containing protein